MELTLLAPMALSAACSRAFAFWAATGLTVGPSMRANTATNVTSTLLISPPEIAERLEGAPRLPQVAADLCMRLRLEREAAVALERAYFGDFFPVVPNSETGNNKAAVQSTQVQEAEGVW